MTGSWKTTTHLIFITDSDPSGGGSALDVNITTISVSTTQLPNYIETVTMHYDDCGNNINISVAIKFIF